MKHIKLFEDFITEGRWSDIMKGVKSGSQTGPWAIVIIKDNKFLEQTLVNVRDAIPGHYEEIKKKFTKSYNTTLLIEDNEGKQVYKEKIN